VTYRVELSEAAYDDLTRLYGFILDRDPNDFALAEEALDAIKAAFKILQLMPYSFRMAKSPDPFLRELVISFGSTGYVALYEISPEDLVMILAVRHQREDDYL
jgi:plasmid stabilization system protein ParE